MHSNIKTILIPETLSAFSYDSLLIHVVFSAQTMSITWPHKKNHTHQGLLQSCQEVYHGLYFKVNQYPIAFKHYYDYYLLTHVAYVLYVIICENNKSWRLSSHSLVMFATSLGSSFCHAWRTEFNLWSTLCCISSIDNTELLISIILISIISVSAILL